MNDRITIAQACRIGGICLAVVWLFQILNLAVFGFGTRLISPFPTSDAYYYLHKAWMTVFLDADGGQLNDHIGPSPYLAMLILGFRLFGSQVFVPYVLNHVLVALTVGGSVVASGVLFGRRAAWATGLVTAMWGTLHFFAELSVKTNAVAAFTALACAFLAMYLRRRHWMYAGLSAAAFAVAALDRANLVVVLPVLILFAAGLAIRRKDYRHATVIVVTMVAAIALVFGITKSTDDAARKYATSPIGINLYVGNNPDAAGGYTVTGEIPNDLLGTHAGAARVAEIYFGHPVTHVDVEMYWGSRAVSYMLQNPVDAGRLWLKKFGMMLSAEAPGHPEQFGVWRFHRLLYYFALLDTGLILVLAAFGLALAWRVQRGATLFWLFSAGGYLMTVVAFFVVERFRMPMGALLLPFAGYGAARITSAAPRTRLVWLLVAAAMYAGCWSLTRLNPEGSGWTTETQARRNVEDFRQQKMLQQQRRRDQAVRRNDAASWAAVAKDFASRFFFRDALLAAQRAVDVEPDHIAGYAFLTRHYMRTKNKDEVERMYLKLAFAKPVLPEQIRAFRNLKGEIATYLRIPLPPKIFRK